MSPDEQRAEAAAYMRDYRKRNRYRDVRTQEESRRLAAEHIRHHDPTLWDQIKQTARYNIRMRDRLLDHGDPYA